MAVPIALIVLGIVVFGLGTRTMLTHKQWTQRVNPGRYLAMGGFFLIVFGVIGLVV